MIFIPKARPPMWLPHIPSWSSAIIREASLSLTHMRRGLQNPYRNSFPSIMVYLAAFFFIICASLGSCGRTPSARYVTYGVIHEFDEPLVTNERIFNWLFLDGISAADTLGVINVSRMTDLCCPGFDRLANLDKRSARLFCSRGTCSSLNAANEQDRVRTNSKYRANKGSLAWNSLDTCPVTRRESLFAISREAPSSLVRSIPTMSASYSA